MGKRLYAGDSEGDWVVSRVLAVAATGCGYDYRAVLWQVLAAVAMAGAGVWVPDWRRGPSGAPYDRSVGS